MEYKPVTNDDIKLKAFILDKLESWKQHRDENYEKLWQEYERIWQGKFAESDRSKQSERARIVSPATQQAVENSRSEIEEAVFGQRKEWFDIEDDGQDKDASDVLQIKKALQERFKKDRIKKHVSQCLTLGQVYGTGIGELQINEVTDAAPATEKLPVKGLAAVGVRKDRRIAVTVRPIVPQNFIIDPNALDIEDALGCAVEEYVSIHAVIGAMEKGIYNPCDLSAGVSNDTDLERTQLQEDYVQGRCRVIRYYGLIPSELLKPYQETDEFSDIENESGEALEAVEGEEEENYWGDDYDDMVEAIVVIANDSHVLKAEVNPLMMEDRPFVVYRPEIVPGRFWGRGTVEKSYNMQKALDGQIRAHLDSVALTAAPMMGIDATRMPRGFKFEIAAGKSIFTNGSPGEILFPLTFGQTSPVNIETAALFEKMLQQATGTMDSAGMPQQVGQQSDPGAMAIAMSGLIKRNKQALMNFQEDFLIPLVEKAAWRYMQFDPDNFPAKDYNFLPISNMGIMAREYEQQQFIGLLQTLGPDSPIVPLITAGIVENSSLSSKEELVQALKQMANNPEAKKQQEQQQALAQQQAIAETQAMSARALREQAEAQKASAEAEAVPVLTKAKLVAALANNLDDDAESKDFERRVKLMELDLKNQELGAKVMDIKSNEKISQMQAATKMHELESKKLVEKMKINRDSEGNISVSKFKE